MEKSRYYPSSHLSRRIIKHSVKISRPIGDIMLIRQFTKLSCIAASIALTNAIFAFSAAYAREQGEQGNPEILGNVNFATSCDPARGRAFQTVRWRSCDSFWYAEAAKALH